MANRRRGSSFGKFDVGDTQGSSISSALTYNAVRHRNLAPPQEDAPVKQNFNEQAASSAEKPADASAKRTGAKLAPVSRSRHLAWVIPALILLSFHFLYRFYGVNNPEYWANRFLWLSYRVGTTTMYGKGTYDFFFIAYHIVVFTFLREFFMQVLLPPVARGLGLRTRHKVSRFLEQAYSLLYYGITGPLGLYIMKYRVPQLWYFNTTAFYQGFPHREIDVWVKAFYLLQASFWGQQAIVLLLQLEQRRKDFAELVVHHIVTVALIWLSYRFHFTHIGLAVYITMDVSDFFLALSKILHYLDSSVVGFFFAMFVAAWIYLRHYLNLVILWSVLTEFRTVGPWILNWETQQYKCWISQIITFALLFVLQLVNLYWLALVIRIGYRYLFESVIEDIRSEDEDEEELSDM